MRYGSLILAAALGLVCSCAKTGTTESGTVLKLQFDAWVEEHNPGTWTETGLGCRICSLTPGERTQKIADAPYVLLSYTMLDTDSTLLSTSERDVAKYETGYESYYSYAPQVFNRSKGVMMAGLDEVLSLLYVGDSCSVAIPPYLTTTERYGTREEYVSNASSSSRTVLYNFKVEGTIEDVEQWQIQTLSKIMPEKIDTLESGVFIDIHDEGDTVEIKAEETVKVLYACRRASDSVVADTNIEELFLESFGVEAKSRTIQPMSVTWSDQSTGIKTSSSSLIQAFSIGLFHMHRGGKATIYLTSTYGYGATGSGGAIPPYCPLYFDVEILE